MTKIAALGLLAGSILSGSAQALVFVPGDLVVAVEGNGVWGASTGPYTDNQAAPLTLMEFTTSGAYVGSETLPQTQSGGNSPVSGEYGSSSEGFIQLSGNGAYLTVMGYGVNAAAFNASPATYGSATGALGQSGSLTNAGYTPVPRVVAVVNQDGVVNSETAIDNIFNGNNPRSVYSANGTSFYVSGQGTSGDTTGGVFYVSHLGAHSATPVTGADTSGDTANQDTRFVTEHNGTLYVSVDSKEGSGSNRDYIGTLGTPPSTGLYTNGGSTASGPTMLSGFGNNGGTGRITISNGTTNGINAKNEVVNLSPEEYFFASPTVLYVADSGDPKNDSATNQNGGTTLGDGGLQKWVYSGGSWSLEYTLGLSQGLPLVANTSASGTSGLYAITGEADPGDPGDELLFVTTYSLTDTGQTYLYDIVDPLSATKVSTASGIDSFALLDTAPADSNFKGVSFAPTIDAPLATPEPATWASLLVGLGLTGTWLRRRRNVTAA